MLAQMMAMALRRAGSSVSLLFGSESVSDDQTFPSSASATYTLNADGTITLTPGGSSGRWLSLGGTAANYDYRATLVTGTLSSGTTGAWTNLASPASFNVVRSSLGAKTCQLTLEVGLAGEDTALRSATITLTALVSS